MSGPRTRPPSPRTSLKGNNLHTGLMLYPLNLKKLTNFGQLHLEVLAAQVTSLRDIRGQLHTTWWVEGGKAVLEGLHHKWVFLPLSVWPVTLLGWSLVMTLWWSQVRAAGLQRANTYIHLQLILSTHSLDYVSLVSPLRASGTFEVLNIQFLKSPVFKKARNTK